MNPVLLAEQEARGALGGIGRTKLFELLAAGAIRSVKVGRRRLVVADSLAEYVTRLEVEQSQPAA